MPWLLGSAMLWFAGFALLVSVAPLWVIRGGSDDLGAGLVTGVMMACTVLAQLSMHRALAGLGWRWTLVLGAGLLGLPALGHLATNRLGPVIALAALRGLGFGIVTVCGATAVASFVGLRQHRVEPELRRRNRARRVRGGCHRDRDLVFGRVRRSGAGRRPHGRWLDVAGAGQTRVTGPGVRTSVVAAGEQDPSGAGMAPASAWASKAAAASSAFSPDRV
jgi:hypothetical protein